MRSMLHDVWGSIFARRHHTVSPRRSFSQARRMAPKADNFVPQRVSVLTLNCWGLWLVSKRRKERIWQVPLHRETPKCIGHRGRQCGSKS